MEISHRTSAWQRTEAKAMTARASASKKPKKPSRRRKKKSSARATRRTVELADGKIAVIKSQPATRVREADKDVKGTYSTIRAILSQATTYRLFDHVSRAPSQYGGSPRTWPNELHSALFALQNVYPELRAEIRELTDDPNRLNLLLTSVAENINDHDARERFLGAIKASRFPARSTIARFRKDHLDHEKMNEHLIQTGIDLALVRGHFDPTSIHDSVNPQWSNVVYSDGTVLKPPSDESFDTAYNEHTGEIWYPKVDVGSQSHTQKSGSEPTVNGTKVTALLTRSQRYLGEIFLGLCITDAPDPATEANDAIQLADLARTYLRSKAPSASIQALVHDGAATGRHHQRLVAGGTLLVNLPPAKAVHDDPETGKKVRDEEYYGDLGVWHHKLENCPGHQLTGIAGDIHLQEIVDGTHSYRKLDHRPSCKTAKGKSYLYEVVKVPCAKNRPLKQASPTKYPTIRIPWHQAQSETEEAYESRMRYSRAWGPSSREGKYLRGVRQSVENRFSILDRAFPFKRVPAYSKGSKLSLMLGYAIGHNLAMAGHERASP